MTISEMQKTPQTQTVCVSAIELRTAEVSRLEARIRLLLEELEVLKSQRLCLSVRCNHELQRAEAAEAALAELRAACVDTNNTLPLPRTFPGGFLKA